VYGTDALKSSTVSKWRLHFQDGSDDQFDLARYGKPSCSDLAAPVQSLLQQFPVISWKTLCRKLKIGKLTCLLILHDDLHLEKFNLRYVPHSLEADQKRSRVELSRELLEILEQDQMLRGMSLVERGGSHCEEGRRIRALGQLYDGVGSVEL
jgi:hypothetical protein